MTGLRRPVNRTVPAGLAARYRDNGWSTTETVGDLPPAGLRSAPAADFRIHSAVRPWSGTYAMVERVAAVVRVRPGHVLPTLQQVREHFADAGVARQKWPEELHEVAGYPRTASGKVQKFLVRQGLQS